MKVVVLLFLNCVFVIWFRNVAALGRPKLSQRLHILERCTFIDISNLLGNFCTKLILWP